MSDAYTRERLLACPLEVKRQGGDYNEAVCQLGVWPAAALEDSGKHGKGQGNAGGISLSRMDSRRL